MNRKTKEMKFFQSNVIAYILLSIILTPLVSLIIETTHSPVIVFLLINLLIVLFLKVMYEKIEYLHTYDAIVSIAIVFQLSLYGTVPFYYVVYGTPILWLAIAYYVATGIYALNIRKKKWSNKENHIVFSLITISVIAISLTMRDEQELIITKVLKENSRGFMQLGFAYIVGVFICWLFIIYWKNPFKKDKNFNNKY